jgi:hypothetical protein
MLTGNLKLIIHLKNVILLQQYLNKFRSKRRGELEATFQYKCATCFFTFSYADNHWNDLHKLMPGGFSADKNVRYQNVLNNPHLVDWYFSYRLNEFLKVVFDGILECEWRWHRFEWQSRLSIHAHGAARFKNDPGLIALTQLIYDGRCAEKKKSELEHINHLELNSLNSTIDLGKSSERRVIAYTNTLLTAMNPRTNIGVENVVPDPHPCSLDRDDIPIDERARDYEDCVNCFQSKY